MLNVSKNRFSLMVLGLPVPSSKISRESRLMVQSVHGGGGGSGVDDDGDGDALLLPLGLLALQWPRGA